MRADGSADIFYVMACVDSTVYSNDRITDYDKFSIQFDGSVDSGGNLWVGLNYTQIGSNVEDDLFLSCVIIDQDGSMRLGTSSAGKAGIYVGSNYVSIKAYNCLGTFRGGDVVFRYGNDINVINRLDDIISALQFGNHQVIDNANQNAQQIQQNQNENTDKVLNGWDSSGKSPDTTTTDDYHDKEQEVFNSTASARSSVVSMFNNFGSLLNDTPVQRGLLACSKIMTEFFSIGWVAGIVQFALTIGAFAFIIGSVIMVVGKVSSNNRANESRNIRNNYFKAKTDYFNSRRKK